MTNNKLYDPVLGKVEITHHAQIRVMDSFGITKIEKINRFLADELKRCMEKRGERQESDGSTIATYRCPHVRIVIKRMSNGKQFIWTISRPGPYVYPTG